MSRITADRGRRQHPKVTATTLAELGSEHLARLLAAAAKADPALKRTLALEVMSEADDLADEIDRQLHRMRTAKERLSAVRAGKLARELARLLDAIGSKLSALDPAAAARRFVSVLDLAAEVLPRRTSEARALVEVFALVEDRLADAVQRASSADQVEVGQPIYAVLTTDSHGVADGLLTRVGPVLHDEARAALRALVEADLASPVARPLGASALRLLRLTGLLGDLADAEGDVDGYIAAQARRAPALRDHVGSARRLFEAGRAAEALDLLKAAPVGAATSGAPAADLRIELLDAIGRRDEAQAERWRHFRTDLSVAALRQHLKRLPSFDDVEREEEALAYVVTHPDTTAALAFLLAWPDHRRAAALIRTRHDRLNGEAHDVLDAAAGALAQKDALASSLALRSMIQAALRGGSRASQTRAGLLLAECATLAAGIDDWGGRLDHAAFVLRLRSGSRIRPSFWKAAAAAAPTARSSSRVLKR